MDRHFEFPKDATPLHDYSGLRLPWIRNSSDLNRAEAENILKAQTKYLRGSIADPTGWFQILFLRSIHQAMFSGVWDWAGVYRKSITSIGIHPSFIPSRMAEFCLEVIAWLQHPVDLTFLEMAARIHHRLVLIHPFENGNGRFARLVADRFLFSFKCPYPFWPNQLNQNGHIRKDYIQTLQSADRGDYEPLETMMKKCGAGDLSLSELLRNKSYGNYVKGARGIALVKALLRSGNNPNDQTENGHRSLQLAIRGGLEGVVRVLVAAGAEVNTHDRSGLTPFQVAIDQENKALADFLLSEGAKRQPPPGLGYMKYYKLYGSVS